MSTDVAVLHAEALPALIDRAAAALANARTSAEVLEARDVATAAYAAAKTAGRFAKAKEAHDEVLAAVYRAQGDALLIESRAKHRLADEYDAAQERGEVKKAGNPNSSNTEELPGPSDLGLSYKDVHEARQIRDAEVADPGIVERSIRARVMAGLEPTKAAVREVVVARGEKEIRAAYKTFQAEAAARKRDARDVKETNLADRIRGLTSAFGSERYGVIYADPPWRFEPYSRDTGMDRAADNHYPTMTLDDIRELPVPAADDCALFLWATAPMLPEALGVMAAWGFTYKSHVVWGKDRIGTGYWARNKHELLLIGTRGSIPAPSPGTQPDSLIIAPITTHSAKPEAFAAVIEGIFPTLPKLEMFARRRRPGWDLWGAEAPEEQAPKPVQIPDQRPFDPDPEMPAFLRRTG